MYIRATQKTNKHYQTYILIQEPNIYMCEDCAH